MTLTDDLSNTAQPTSPEQSKRSDDAYAAGYAAGLAVYERRSAELASETSFAAGFAAGLAVYEREWAVLVSDALASGACLDCLRRSSWRTGRPRMIRHRNGCPRTSEENLDAGRQSANTAVALSVGQVDEVAPDEGAAEAFVDETDEERWTRRSYPYGTPLGRYLGLTGG